MPHIVTFTKTQHSNYTEIKMNKHIKPFLALTIIFLTTMTTVNAQKTALDSATLSQQFQYVKKISSSYQEFKVIKGSRLNKLWSNAMDSLTAVRENLTKTDQVISTQKKEINNLNTELTNTKEQLASVNEEKDNISLLGMGMSKGKYKTIMWSAIIGLLALFGLAFFKFKNSNQITKTTRKDYQDIQEEYNDFKSNALEKERKLKRELQTELNKIEDLKRKMG